MHCIVLQTQNFKISSKKLSRRFILFLGKYLTILYTFDSSGRHPRRSKRYALQGSRWRVKDLTYKISRYPTSNQMTRRDVDSEIKKALSVWSEHTDLTFTQKRSGKVHLDMSFLKVC